MPKINTLGNQEKYLVTGKASVFFLAIFRARMQWNNTYNIHKKKNVIKYIFFNTAELLFVCRGRRLISVRMQ